MAGMVAKRARRLLERLDAIDLDLFALEMSNAD